MDSHTLRTLEYDRIIEQLEKSASSEVSRRKLSRLTPSPDVAEVRQRLASTQEGLDVLRLRGDLPLEGLQDIRSALRRANIGGVLSPSELLQVASTAACEKQVRKLIEGIDEEERPLPILRGLTDGLEELSSLARIIRNAIDEEGRVMDQASPELARIRRAILQLQAGIRASLEQILRSPHYQKMLQEGIITQRNDRYVVPVKQEYRGAFSGIIHDQSASGQTLFIEPESVVNQNNRMRELELDERREVERILGELTLAVQENSDALEHNLDLLTQWDVIFAKSRLGKRLKGICPHLDKEGSVELKQARHPLIAMDDVVPIDVSLDGHTQAIIITGPNTGGKTVTLKTIGLLSLMAQSGIPIPAEEGSRVAVFKDVFADIGDEQSIEQNLSTFSSHMTHIIRILERIDSSSLVLLDELGAGTDPTEGAALAIAILDHIIKQGSRLVATTHYTELKVFAHARKGVINASVEFDVETLSPTYRLLVGVPGRSNAFEIARRLGLPDQVVQEAKAQISHDENRLEEMIGSLATDTRTASEKRKEAEALRREADQLLSDLKAQWRLWEEEKEKLKEAARRDAQSVVARAKRESEAVLEELRQWTREQRGSIKEHQLIEARKRLEEAAPEADWPRPVTGTESEKNRSIAVGDEVFIRTFGQKGQVIEALGEDAFQVQVGAMKMKVDRNNLEWRSTPKRDEAVKGSTSYRRSSSSVRHELDLRGKLVEEAIPEIDKYLDDALLAGYEQITLIHGKGTGALRNGVQRYLDRHARVETYRSGGQGEGGLGVTVVQLR
ncbi:endonuclease MutS2 [Desmospora profundinema]|uniref:Endonuclease MutS2 n=1 Tax=Desmospora profundinema TaxID=1571184 RepID=A0ABU1IP73_9BACL|nr:endonuclease MutS2 [Desmospora profundinema]MDR6226521.1 DNA mismatch repair protein MutS2 [Desmospora profundinema]